MTAVFSTVIFLLLLIAFSANADFQKIKFKNCKSAFNIKNVEVSGCVGSSKGHCAFKKGTTPRLRIEFVPTRTTETLETTVRAKIAGSVIVSFNLEQKDPCKGGNLTCPLKEGETYYYEQGVTILKEYPKAYFIFFKKTICKVRGIVNDPTYGEKDKYIITWRRLARSGV